MELRPSVAGGSLRGALPVPAHPQGLAAAMSQCLLSRLHALRFPVVQKLPLGTNFAVSSLSPLHCSSVALAGPVLAFLPDPPSAFATCCFPVQSAPLLVPQSHRFLGQELLLAVPRLTLRGLDEREGRSDAAPCCSRWVLWRCRGVWGFSAAVLAGPRVHRGHCGHVQF